MLRTIGRDLLLFTNVPPRFLAQFPPEYHSRFTAASARSLFPIERVCLLDDSQHAVRQLEPSDARRFDHFLLGGILGDVDDCDQDRTSELRSFGYECRNLEHLQMTTDTAAIVVHRVINQQAPLSACSFVDRPEIALSPNERIVFPFRLLAKDGSSGEPVFAPGIQEALVQEQFQ